MTVQKMLMSEITIPCFKNQDPNNHPLFNTPMQVRPNRGVHFSPGTSHLFDGFQLYLISLVFLWPPPPPPPPQLNFQWPSMVGMDIFWHHKFYFTSLDNFVHRKMGNLFPHFFCEVKQFAKNNPVSLKFFVLYWPQINSNILFNVFCVHFHCRC